ncbi:MAG: alpha/beta hydrolase [Gemmatimonadales bacterium]
MLDFHHRYVPPDTPGASPTLLLLHGTGGDEHDLIPLGQMIAPGAGFLSPRGKVVEHGAPRFFRRLAEGVFDLEDLAVRTEELGDFVTAAATEYGFDATRVIAVGFSNGANIAASMLLRRPGLLYGAVLLSPMLPYEPNQQPNLGGTSVLIGAGRTDPIVPTSQVDRLAEVLRQAGAAVTVHWEPGGHTVARGEVDAALGWLRSLTPT